MLIEGIVGAVTGIVGTVATAITNYKTQKLKNEHDVAMAKIEHEAMIAEAEIGMKVTEQKLQGELAMADAEIYKSNVKLGNGRAVSNSVIERLLEGKWTKWVGTLLIFLLGLADVMRTMMRPLLTVYLVAVTSWVTYEAGSILAAKQALISATLAATLFTNVTNIVIFLTVSAVTWWFGNRSLEKYMKEMQHK